MGSDRVGAVTGAAYVLLILASWRRCRGMVPADWFATRPAATRASPASSRGAPMNLEHGGLTLAGWEPERLASCELSDVDFCRSST